MSMLKTRQMLEELISKRLSELYIFFAFGSQSVNKPISINYLLKIL